MTQRLRRVGDALRTGFWAVPSACVLVAVALALLLVELDRARERTAGLFLFGAGPDGAREVLSAITTSMITFTGLVFSITIVVLQLTSSQFSPRVLRTFLRDRQTQLALGVFVATFVYAVMVLRAIDSRPGAAFVPAVSTTVGVALLLVSVGMFISYIHHISTAIQASSLIRAVGDETRRVLDRRVPPDAPEPANRTFRTAPATSVLTSPAFGVVTSIDERSLVRVAAAGDVLLVLRVGLGDFVPRDAPLLEVQGAGVLDEDAVAAAVAAVALGKDRTMEQDVAFGFRQLVDIAARALSPGVNDPTTAVQALDELHDLLRRLVTRALPDGLCCDAHGQVRLVTRPVSLDGYLDLALQEITQYGGDAPRILARVDSLLRDLEQAALPRHRAAVRAQQLREAAARRT